MSRSPRVLAALLTLALLAPTSALADEASDAPVTVDDTVMLDGNSTQAVDVIANDSDPNGDDVTVCRVSVPKGAPLYVDAVDDLLYVSSTTNKTATYEITYYACDFDYLTPATLTVEVTKVPEIEATKLRRPGLVRFTNPGTKKVVVLYGSRKKSQPDGKVKVAPQKSETVSVIRKKLYYVAFVRGSGSFAGSGTVKHITLPEYGKGLGARPSFGATTLKAWTTAP